MDRSFELFLGRVNARFRSIARATKGEKELGDLQNDAWLIADEIGRRRARAVDFADPVDEGLVIGAIVARNIKWGDWRMRKSVRIDQDADSEGGVPAWHERLPASVTSDPLMSLMARESELSAECMLASSYSQAAAYVMIFVHFKQSLADVCAHLAISRWSLANRVAIAACTVRRQRSLFDCVERIDDAFMPPPGKAYPARTDSEAGRWHPGFSAQLRLKAEPRIR